MSYSISQKITVSFTTDGVPPVVKAMQYDNNMRIVEVVMTANGVPYHVPDGYSVNIRMRKPDGTCVYNPALEVSGNTAKIVLTQQMLAFSGKAAAILEVTGGENGADVLGSAQWNIDIAPNPVPEEFVESTDEYKTIQELCAMVSKAADSAEASAANAGAAASQAAVSAGDASRSEQSAAASASQAGQSAANAASSASAASAKAEEAAASASTASAAAAEATANAEAAQLYAEMAQQVSQGAVGYYATPEALRSAHATASDGNWAIVGSTDTVWVWDSDSGDWRDTSQRIDMSQYYTKSEVQAQLDAIGTISAEDLQTLWG